MSATAFEKVVLTQQLHQKYIWLLPAFAGLLYPFAVMAFYRSRQLFRTLWTWRAS
jgi:hypothetical protein